MHQDLFVRATIASTMFFVVALFEQPANAQTLTYHNGPLVEHPRVFISYWNWPGGAGDDPVDAKGHTEGLLARIGGTKYIGLLSQYSTLSYTIHNDLPNSAPQTWADATPWLPDNPPNDRHPSASEIVAAVNRAAAHFSPGRDDIIFLMTGPNRTSYVGPGCAYHSAIFNNTAFNHPILYAELPYQSDVLDPPRWSFGPCKFGDAGEFVGLTAYHELVETITDPLSSGWRDDVSNNEIADQLNRTIRKVRLDSSSRLYMVSALLSSNSGGSGAFFFANKVDALGAGNIFRSYWVDAFHNTRAITFPYLSGNQLPDSLVPDEMRTGVGAVWESPNVLDVFALEDDRLVRHEDSLGASSPTIEDLGPADSGWKWAFTPDAASTGGDNAEVFVTAETSGCPGASCRKVRRRGRDAGSWGAWEDLPVPATGIGSGPGAVSWGPGTPIVSGYSYGFKPLSVAVLDQSSPPHLLVAQRLGPSFSWTWFDADYPHGAELVGSPDISSFDIGEFDVWIADKDGHVWGYKADSRPGSQESKWYDYGIPVDGTTGLSAPVIGDITASSQGDASLLIAAAVAGNKVVVGGFEAGGLFLWGGIQTYVHNGYGWDLTCR